MGFRAPARGVRPGDLEALAARVDTVDAAATAAGAAAGTAQTAADTAQTAADTAQTAADTAQSEAERKARVFTNPSTDPPVAEGANDLWMVIDQGNLMRRSTAAGAGHWQDLWDFGTASQRIVSGGLGRVTFPHRLDGTPSAVVVTLRANAVAQSTQLFSKDANNFTITFRDGTGALVPDGTQVGVDYIAVR